MRAARRAAGLTLQQLADRAGCAKSYLSQLENGFRPGSGVSLRLLARLEAALGLTGGELVFAAQWEATPGPVRRELARVEAERRAAADQLRELLRGDPGAEPGDAGTGESAGGAGSGGSGGGGAGRRLDELYHSGRLRALIDRIAGADAQSDPAAAHAPHAIDAAGRPVPPRSARPASGELDVLGLPIEVPLINSVAAGYPTDFTDLGYPARVADEYVRVPDVRDPDAFAARVVGDSMLPDYREGDIVVFSPARDLKDGLDCFVRLEPDHESTFKRVYFERSEDVERSGKVAEWQSGEADESGEARAGDPGRSLPLGHFATSPLPEDRPCGQYVRLQPLNPKYPSTVIPRERVAGLYAAVSVTRMV